VIAKADFYTSHSYTQLLRLTAGDISQPRVDMHIAISMGFSFYSRISEIVNKRMRRKKATLGDALYQRVMTTAAEGI
jgi:hypothetical protein